MEETETFFQLHNWFFQILFPNSLCEWLQLVPEIQNLESIVVFTSKLLSFIRPSKIYIFNVNDPEGVKYLTRLCLRFSHFSEHKFRHDFLDTLKPLCNCSLEVEGNEHFCCAASILKMLEGPSSLTYQASIHLLKFWPIIWKLNCFLLVIQNFLLLIMISF